jgi:hypothetical protein
MPPVDPLLPRGVPTGLPRAGFKPRRAFGDPIASPKANPRFIPPPAPRSTNFTLRLADVMPVDPIVRAGRLVFHSVGDTGGAYGPDVQDAVAERMEAQYNAAPDGSRPAFFYHLGDVIYFNGQSALYRQQFYEPYQYYPPYIFAIPGNHDGDTRVQKGDPADPEPTLTGFIENFCDSQPRHLEPYRATMTQPYVYWVLDAPFATIIGLYSNVDGSLDGRGTASQQIWLEGQLRQAPADKCLIVAVHHPPYSLDRVHGGSPDVVAALEKAMADARRAPDAVFSGHVHSYQRFTRDRQGHQIPHVVAGAGGLANKPSLLHKLQTDGSKKIKPGKAGFKTTEPDVVLNAYNDADPGFLRVTVDATTLTGEYFLVPFQGAAPDQPADQFVLDWHKHKLK